MTKQLQISSSICDYYNTLINSGSLSEEQIESLQIAVQCISDSFSIDLTAKSDFGPISLEKVFENYKEEQKETSPEMKKESPEELKREGNKFMGLGEYLKAIESYSKAIEIEPSAVFYANRFLYVH